MAIKRLAIDKSYHNRMEKVIRYWVLSIYAYAMIGEIEINILNDCKQSAT